MGRHRIEGRSVDAQPNFNGGRPGIKRTPAPPGQLCCTKGKHFVPISDMPITKASNGKFRYGSWCFACRSEHGRLAARAEAAARRNAQGGA